MNAPAALQSIISEDMVRSALARARDQRPVDVLAAIAGVPSELFVEQAAEYFGLEPISMSELRDCTADFGLVSFVEATQRQCLAVIRKDGRRLLVLTDPLDVRTRAWAVYRLRRQRAAEVEWALASGEDLRAFLTLAEKSLRAMDSVGLEPASAAGRDALALSVSIADISASDSPIVRLVDSTIHDALEVRGQRHPSRNAAQRHDDQVSR